MHCYLQPIVLPVIANCTSMHSSHYPNIPLYYAVLPRSCVARFNGVYWKELPGHPSVWDSGEKLFRVDQRSSPIKCMDSVRFNNRIILILISWIYPHVPTQQIQALVDRQRLEELPPTTAGAGITFKRRQPYHSLPFSSSLSLSLSSDPTALFVVCPSVRPSVRLSVRPSVRLSVRLSVRVLLRPSPWSFVLAASVRHVCSDSDDIEEGDSRSRLHVHQTWGRQARWARYNWWPETGMIIWGGGGVRMMVWPGCMIIYLFIYLKLCFHFTKQTELTKW